MGRGINEDTQGLPLSNTNNTTHRSNDHRKLLPNEVPEALVENPEIANTRDFKVSVYHNPEFLFLSML